MNIHFISLGCPRNLVDTEVMMGRLVKNGHTITEKAEDADCAVINTCSFIQPAVEESIEAILEMAQWKNEKPGRRLVVAGCLPERYRQDLADSLSEVDVFIGTGAFTNIENAVRGDMDDSRITLPPPRPLAHVESQRIRFHKNLPHLAYLKISEGCSGRCTYCIIPTLRGPQRSRPTAQILEEAKVLVGKGVKEIVLVAQNTSAYGTDRNNEDGLPDLLKRISDMAPSSWIRVLYGHPDFISDRLIETIHSYDNICPYFDIPVQHISPSVLKKMGRNHDNAQIRAVFERIRHVIPDAALRTTLIVGFPGETDADIDMLLDFIQTVKFDHLGAFTYSDDKDLPSHRLKDHVAENIKRERMEQVMTLQATISLAKNQRYLGKTFSALVDDAGATEPYSAAGRTPFQAHEIDGLVRIKGSVKQGSFIDVRISKVDEYDLMGEVV